MSKSILVIDTPENCYNCDLKYGYFCGKTKRWIDEDCFPKPDWCPFRDLPEKKEVRNFCLGEGDCEQKGYQKGFNSCIDEILKGGDTE